MFSIPILLCCVRSSYCGTKHRQFNSKFIPIRDEFQAAPQPAGRCQTCHFLAVFQAPPRMAAGTLLRYTGLC
jgi:hypothetical protein